MSHDVIMPALGMAQDTGLLVAWRKAPGDRVAVGDALFEVETDKATMEVEATAEGYLSAVTAGEGEDVPVGHVIARIVATAADVDLTAMKAKAVVAPEKTPLPSAREVPASAPVTAAPPASPPKPAVPVASSGRILASPKARQMAAEQGLDLARLAKAGHPQPYHVADLKLFGALGGAGRSVLTARADSVALGGLLAKAAGSDLSRLYAAFVAGAWRHALGRDDLAVTVQRADGSQTEVKDGGTALLLVDLTDTRLTGHVPQGSGLALCLSRDGGGLALTLSYDEAELPFAAAVAWLNELAARIEDPIRQLV